MNGPEIAPTIRQRLIARVMRQFGHPRGALGWLAGQVMLRRNRERVRWAVERLEPRDTDQVLEIGFGPGLSLQWIGPRVAGLCGLDLSAQMVATARRRMRAFAHVDLRQGSVMDPPDFARRFNKLLAINSFQFWPDPVAALTGLRRLMKPGGMAVIAVQPRHPGATSDDTSAIETRIKTALEAAGYVIRDTAWNAAIGGAPGVCVRAIA